MVLKVSADCCPIVEFLDMLGDERPAGRPSVHYPGSEITGVRTSRDRQTGHYRNRKVERKTFCAMCTDPDSSSWCCLIYISVQHDGGMEFGNPTMIESSELQNSEKPY